MVAIEIFRSGTHTSMDGQTLTFSDDDLKKVALAYDPARHEAPICVGHPQHDAPAYGWVRDLSFGDGMLRAELDQVDDAFAELVKAGRYKHVSAAFYPPGSVSEDGWYLRHVGFLGAQPPAVKGLKTAAFAEAEVRPVVFGDFDDLTVSGMFRALRDWMIGQFGQDAADKVLPSWQIDQLQNGAAAELYAPSSEPMATPAYSEAQSSVATDPAAAVLDERQADLDRREAELRRREAALRADEDARFADGLIAQGRLLPTHRAGIVGFLGALQSGPQPIAFSDGGKRAGAVDWFRAFLAALPAQVTFEAARADPTVVETSDPRALADEAARFVEAQAATGLVITHAQAVQYLTANR